MCTATSGAIRKRRAAWIEGSDTEREWKQLLFRRDGSLVENKLYNPIMQNRGHVAHLKKLLGGRVPMWSVIVFSDNTDIDRIKVSYPDNVITRESGLRIVVGNLFWNAPEKLTEDPYHKCKDHDLIVKMIEFEQ